MKNLKIILFFLFLIIPLNTFGRSFFDVKIGVGRSNFYTSTSDLVTSYTMGVSQNIYIKNSDMIISFGGNFVQRGSKLNEVIVFTLSTQPNFEIYQYDFTITMSYFEIPVLFKFDFKVKEKFSIIPYAGGSFSFAVSSRAEMDNRQLAGTASELEPDVISNQEEQHLNNDYGIIAGIDFKYFNLSLGTNYYYGMNNIDNVSNFSGFDDRIHSFQITFAYSF